ncbi:MAG: YARHG domain-containing protein [Treponema sp.]|jgi:hypothetical protein|nr:YARHG domain-containing protein [Treponema sp.]
MRKYVFIIILIAASQFAFSQSDVMKFLSLGFNKNDWNNLGITHYFYGYEDYSEAIININNFHSGLQLSMREPNTFYPIDSRRFDKPPTEYVCYSGHSGDTGYHYSDPNGPTALEKRIEEGRLVNWTSVLITRRGEYVPWLTTNRIEQDEESITVYFARNGTGEETIRYYNIPRTQLFEIFQKKYVQLICEIVNMINETNDNNEYIAELIRSRTQQELAIFRNCLYAIKGYRFFTPVWLEYFNKYLEGYRAQYSANYAAKMFTNNEIWLLHLILQCENRV